MTIVQSMSTMRSMTTERADPGSLSQRELLGELYDGRARCIDSGLDPEEWFPVAVDVTRARAQAARAIALCEGCTVRAACLEVALRQSSDAGDGVWGGMVAAERAGIRARWARGTSVTEFLH